MSLAGPLISAGTGNSVGLSLQLSADEGIVNTNTEGATFTVSSPVDLNGYNLLVSAADSTGTTVLDGQISGAGGLTIDGNGQSVLNADNLYTGVTTVNSGTLVVENASGLGASGAGNETDVENYATLELEGSITVTGEALTSSTSAEITSVGANVWTGGMTVTDELDVYVDTGNSLEVGGNVAANYVYNYEGGQLTVDGNLTGYDLYNYGAGTVTLKGPANVLQYYVENYGVLEVDGTLSTVYYNVDNYQNATLQGTGTIDASTSYGELIYNYGTLSPGTSGVPGILNTSSIDLVNNGTYGNFNVLLNGTTAGSEYSQLNVTGSVYVGGNLNVSLGYTPTIGDTYMIVKNDGTDAVSGTFTGLAEGATVSAGGYDFKISYVGGTGNDVVLIAQTGNPDTTPPTATIDKAVGQDDPTNDSTIHFTVVFSKIVSGFTAGDIDFTGSTDAGLLSATVTSSDQITFDVAVTGMVDDGPVTINFAADAATDGGGKGNLAPTVIDNTVTYDDTPPTVTISAPSASYAAGGPISYTVSYSDADLGAITLTSADVTVNFTGTAAASTVDVTPGVGTTETVTLSGITGDGTLGISLAADTASDLAGNQALAAGPSTTFIVDNTPPTVTIGDPSASYAAGGPISYTVTYSDANFGTITLAPGDVTLNLTGTANATTVDVSSVDSTTELVTISGITGDGTLGISLAANTASDLAGNEAPTAGPSTTFIVDNTPPTVTIGDPSASYAAGGPISYTVTYSDANFGTITLAPGDVTLNLTGTANATTVDVSSVNSTTELITISGITGDGTLGISLAANTASDLAGNEAPTAGPSTTLIVDNTPPTVTISGPSAPVAAGGPISYTVTYADANFNADTLTSADVTLNTSGTANATTVGVFC